MTVRPRRSNRFFINAGLLAHQAEANRSRKTVTDESVDDCPFDQPGAAMSCNVDEDEREYDIDNVIGGGR